MIIHPIIGGNLGRRAFALSTIFGVWTGFLLFENRGLADFHSPCLKYLLQTQSGTPESLFTPYHSAKELEENLLAIIPLYNVPASNVLRAGIWQEMNEIPA